MKTYTSNHIVFFSPTHTSAKIARAIGESIGMGRRIEIDLTTDENSSPIEIKDSITIIAVPVYAGRVAPIALQRLRRLKGNNAPAILVAVYGNRDYEDALVELRDETIQLGFTPLAAGLILLVNTATAVLICPLQKAVRMLPIYRLRNNLEKTV